MATQRKKNTFRTEQERRENEGQEGKSQGKSKSLYSLRLILDRSYESELG